MTDTLATLRTAAARKTTPDEDRELGNLALLAVGWTQDYPRPHEPTCPLMWKAPNSAPDVFLDRWFPDSRHPNPWTSVDDAIRWVVPKSDDLIVDLKIWVNKKGKPYAQCFLDLLDFLIDSEIDSGAISGTTSEQAAARALCIAGLAAREEER